MGRSIRQGVPERRIPPGVVVGRALHGLITAVFVLCIGEVYLAAARRRVTGRTLMALGALAGEGLLVAQSGGDCPLGPLFRQWGDDRTFFELLMPSRLARAAVPAFGVISGAGVVGLLLRAGHGRSAVTDTAITH